MALNEQARHPQRKGILIVQFCAVLAERATVCAGRQVKAYATLLQDRGIDRRQLIWQRDLASLKALTGTINAVSMRYPQLV